MKKEKEYTFLEWVFEVVGLTKFFIYYIVTSIIAAIIVLAFVWWYVNPHK
jgi:hypothetical protein